MCCSCVAHDVGTQETIWQGLPSPYFKGLSVCGGQGMYVCVVIYRSFSFFFKAPPYVWVVICRVFFLKARTKDHAPTHAHTLCTHTGAWERACARGRGLCELECEWGNGMWPTHWTREKFSGPHFFYFFTKFLFYKILFYKIEFFFTKFLFCNRKIIWVGRWHVAHPLERIFPMGRLHPNFYKNTDLRNFGNFFFEVFAIVTLYNTRIRALTIQNFWQALFDLLDANKAAWGIYVYTCVCVCMYMYVYVCMYVCMFYTYVYVYNLCILMCTHTNTHTHK